MFIRVAAVLLGISAGIYALTDVGEANPPGIGRAGDVNPLGIFYDKSLDGVEEYQRPTALIVSGNCNRDDPRFTQARAAGAEVLAYINPTAVYDALPCRSQNSLYGPDRERVPLWPFPNYGERVSWKNTHMTDIRAGSAWSNHVVEYVEKLKPRRAFFTHISHDLDHAATEAELPPNVRLAYDGLQLTFEIA